MYFLIYVIYTYPIKQLFKLNSLPKLRFREVQWLTCEGTVESHGGSQWLLCQTLEISIQLVGYPSSAHKPFDIFWLTMNMAARAMNSSHPGVTQTCYKRNRIDQGHQMQLQCRKEWGEVLMGKRVFFRRPLDKVPPCDHECHSSWVARCLRVGSAGFSPEWMPRHLPS